MSNSYLDPKLYEAVRTGNKAYIREHGLISEEEKKAFEDAANDVDLENPKPKGYVVSDPENQHPLLGVTCSGDTVLHIAAQFGQTNLAKKICRVGACLLTRVNDKLETPLHYAAQAGNHVLVEHFMRIACHGRNNIDSGELLRQRNKEGETALYQAVRHQRKDVVEKLLEADPNLASISDYKIMSPLYLAATLESLSTFSSLCRHLLVNASREAYSGPDGQTAMHAAALSKEKGILQEILRRKPKMAKFTDNSGNTPLHYAAINNNIAAAKMLLHKDRTSAYIANNSSDYAVHVAAKSGHVRMVDELFKQCPDSDILLDGQGKNFLHLAVEAQRREVVWWVHRNSVQLEKAMNAQDHYGNTPLHLAVRAGRLNIVIYLLLSKRVHLNWVNNDQMTPLDIAFAEMKSGLFANQQNPDYVIYNTLREIGCNFGRRFSTSVEMDIDQQTDEERDKEMRTCDNMAKTLSIGSVLMASAAFAAAFTVYNLYDDRKGYNNHHLAIKTVFLLFFILDAYAFFCSIIATNLLLNAALPFVDLESRKYCVLRCTSLVTLAARCFIVAFTTGAYVILLPVREWLAYVIFTVGLIAPLIIHPRKWPNIWVLCTIARYNSWRSLWTFFGPQWIPLYGNIFYINLVVGIVFNGLDGDYDYPEKCERNYSCAHRPLVMIIVFLGFVSIPQFLGPLMGQEIKTKIKTNNPKHLIKYFLIVSYFVGFYIYIALALQ